MPCHVCRGLRRAPNVFFADAGGVEVAIVLRAPSRLQTCAWCHGKGWEVEWSEADARAWERIEMGIAERLGEKPRKRGA